MGDRIRQREFHQCEGLALRRSEILQAASILGERTVVAMFYTMGFSDESAVSFEEAGKVNEMTVGIVADEQAKQTKLPLAATTRRGRGNQVIRVF